MKISDLIKELNKSLIENGDLLVTCTCNEIGGVSEKVSVSCEYSNIFDEKQTDFVDIFSFKIEGEE